MDLRTASLLALALAMSACRGPAKATFFVPRTTRPAQPLATGQDPASLEVDADRVYWANRDHTTTCESLRSVPKAGGAVVTHFATTGPDACAFANDVFAVEAGTIYTTYRARLPPPSDRFEFQLLRIEPGAPAPTVLATLDEVGSAVTYDAANVYVAAGYDVWKVAKADGAKVLLMTYDTSSGSPEVRAVAKVPKPVGLKPGEHDAMHSGFFRLRTLAVDNGTLYASFPSVGIVAVSTSGGPVRTLTGLNDGAEHAESLAVYQDRLYYRGSYSEALLTHFFVSSVRLAGGESIVHVLETGLPVRVHAGGIFYGVEDHIRYWDARTDVVEGWHLDDLVTSKTIITDIAVDDAALFYGTQLGGDQGGTIVRVGFDH